MKFLDKRYPPGGVSPIYIYIYREREREREQGAHLIAPLRNNLTRCIWGYDPADQLQGSLGPSGPSILGSVPENEGVRRSVPQGVPGVLWAPRSGVSKKCPETVSRVPKTCPRHSRDTFWTHPEPEAQMAPGTPRGTLRRTPFVFGTLGTLPGTLGPQGRETPGAGRRDRNIREQVEGSEIGDLAAVAALAAG